MSDRYKNLKCHEKFPLCYDNILTWCTYTECFVVILLLQMHILTLLIFLYFESRVQCLSFYHIKYHIFTLIFA